MSETIVPTLSLHRRLARAVRTGPWIQLTVLVAAWVAELIVIPGSSSQTSIYSLLILSAFLGLAAAGQTLVVLLGGIDLSVPSLIGGANIVFALLTGGGWPFWVALLLVLAVATVLGGLNGVIVHVFGLPPLIVTLATGSIVLGLALVITNGGNAPAALPDDAGSFASPVGTTGPIPVPPIVVVWLLLALVMGAVLAWTVTGRRIYAAGSSPRAAELSLVRVGRLRVGAFAASGLTSAALGVILLAYGGAGQPSIGDPYLFTSLAAVLVGGTSILGGSGSYWRTIIGAIIIELLSILLVGIDLGEWAQQALTGIVIFAAVALFGREVHLRNRV